MRMILGLLFLGMMVGNLSAQTVERMIRWSSDGALLASATTTGLQIYDRNFDLQQMILPGESILCIDWQPDGNALALTIGNTVQIWARDATDMLSLTQELPLSNEAIGVFWNADGSRLAAFNGISIRLLDIDMAEGVPISPGYYATVMVWDTSRLPVVRVVVETSDAYLAPYGMAENLLDWHPTDPFRFAITGKQISTDGTNIFVINSETGLVTQTLPVFDIFYSVAWHPDGDHIVFGGEARGTEIDINTGEITTRYSGLAQTLQWRTDGAYLLKNGSIYADDASEWEGNLPPASVRTWHPSNREITAIGNGRLTTQDPSMLIADYVQYNRPPVVDLSSFADVSVAIIPVNNITYAHDPDGDPLSYQWAMRATDDADWVEIYSGTEATVELNIGAIEACTFSLQLTATDAYGDSAAEVTTVRVCDDAP